MPRLALLLAAGALLLASCSDGGRTTSASESTTTTASSATTEASGSGDGIDVESIGLRLVLPESFEVADEPTLLLLARSDSPPAVLSIAAEAESVLDHEPEGDEIVTVESIDGVDVTVIRNAVLPGLPEGIAANELLVANGDRSFSLVFSTVEAELEPLWDEIFGSLEIA